MVEAQAFEETIEETKELYAYRPNPTYIYICGKTQGGKSTLIKLLTGDQSIVIGGGR